LGLEPLKGDGIAVRAVLQAAVYPGNRRARRPGALQNVVVYHALAEIYGHLIALLHRLKLRHGAQVVKKALALVHGLEREYRLIHIVASGFFILLVHIAPHHYIGYSLLYFITLMRKSKEALH